MFVKYSLNKIIFPSTAAVYGNSKSGYCSEKSKLKPMSMYAKSKLKFENFLKKTKKNKFNNIKIF